MLRLLLVVLLWGCSAHALNVGDSVIHESSDAFLGYNEGTISEIRENAAGMRVSILIQDPPYYGRSGRTTTDLNTIHPLIKGCVKAPVLRSSPEATCVTREALIIWPPDRYNIYPRYDVAKLTRFWGKSENIFTVSSLYAEAKIKGEKNEMVSRIVALRSGQVFLRSQAPCVNVLGGVDANPGRETNEFFCVGQEVFAPRGAQVTGIFFDPSNIKGQAWVELKFPDRKESSYTQAKDVYP